MKNIIKQWWFWLIIAILVIVCIFVKQYIENRVLERKFEKMGEGASSFYKGTQNTQGYLDKFTYNYSTGRVDYTY